MTDPRWNRAKELFQEALDQPGPDRARFVEAACADDADLRAQIDALLAAHDEAGGFLASPTGPGALAAGDATASSPQETPGARVGPYKLLQVIGEGGFGIVYMAEQEQPIRRRVALKIIKLGMDTREVIARFEAERQALAMMEHPNIARVLDAGATESGRPYFVMELVQGVPITTYCDGNRLSTRERLDLFADVCRAIHHAHEKGIIHRDIKPSNVMVTLHDGTPVPKIIDFGVAKATNQRLTEKTLFTAYGQFVGTPAYMSPEQAEMSGLEIDRRSDIYSLGVLLYELLTGTTPFDAETLRTRGFLEIMRVIREEDPPTPSGRLSTLGDRLIEVAGRRQVEPHALQRLIRGDLDWIVMKAIDKDRRRRYGSAPEFLDDVTRYFRDEPVTARPPSAGYRFGKFAKRHHGQVVAAGVIAVVVVGSALAQVAGVFTSSASESAIPSRRLFLDRLNVTRAVPTQDGRHVLQYNPERGGLELVDVGSGQPTLLSRTVGPAPLIKDVSGPDPRFFHYALAPDRKQISVVHWISSENDRQPSPERDGGLELRLHQVGGEGDGRLLTRWPEPGYHIQVFGWSPDRARVWVFVMRPDRAAEIVSVAVADGARQVLRTLAWRSHTQRPSLSPDGRLITYHDAQRPQDAPDIFLLGTDGSAPIRIEHPANDSKPIFTPDGSGVVFHSDRTGGGLWFLPVVNGRPAGEPRLVWADVGPFGVANVFADNGSLIYYFAITGWEIYTAPIDLGRGIVGTPEHLVPLRGEMNNAPAFSPDGQSLGYLRDRGRRLVLRNLATSVEREFPIAGSLLAPGLAYCPDGRSAIVSGSEQGGSVVYRVNLDRGGAERLPIETSSVACLADGHDIIYLRSTRQQRFDVIRRSLATGLEIKLHDGLATTGGIARSNDSSRIAFVEQRNEEVHLVVMPSTGGAPVTVASSPIMRGFGRSWSDFHGVMWLPDGNGLLVSRRSGGDDANPVVTLWRVPLDGSPATSMGRMPLPIYKGGTFGSGWYQLHPSGSRIAFQRHSGTVSQYWAIDNLAQFIRSGGSIAVPPDPRSR